MEHISNDVLDYIVYNFLMPYEQCKLKLINNQFNKIFHGSWHDILNFQKYKRRVTTRDINLFVKYFGNKFICFNTFSLAYGMYNILQY